MFDEDLLRHLEMLFFRSTSLHDFREWFSNAWWIAEPSVSEELYAFASRIEHLIYILDTGEWDEHEFLANLREEAERFYGKRLSDISAARA